MSSARTRVLALSILCVIILLVTLSRNSPSRAQDGTAKLEGKCNCDMVESSGCRGAYTPPPPPKKSPPLPPVKKRAWKNVYPNKAPPVPDEPGLPDINKGSGVAADTESNFEKGQTNDYVHRNQDGTMSQDGYYAERRRYIYNAYKYAQDQVGRDGGITQDYFEQLEKALKNKLEKVNAEENEAYQKENAEENEARLKDLRENVDPQNRIRTQQILDAIEEMDLDNFEEGLRDALEQVVKENFEQGREQELAGGNGSEAAARGNKIISKLLEKFAKDCGKKKLKTTTIIAVQHAADLAGIDAGNALAHCMSATAVAKLNAGGIQYEAKKCVMPKGYGTERFEGEWHLTISGAMNGTGMIRAKLGSGDWESTAYVAGGTITQDGPAELISGGGFCGVKLTSANAVGMIEGYRVRMPGVSGILPITIIDEKCSVGQ